MNHVNSEDISPESCGLHDKKFSGIVSHPTLSAKEFHFMAKSLAVVAPHEYEEFLRTCCNDGPSSNNNVSVSRAVGQLLKRTASRWAGIRGEPGYDALSWLVYHTLVEINFKKESHKDTTEEEIMAMNDFEQTAVYHSIPNRLLEQQTSRLKEGGAAPSRETEKKTEGFVR